MPVVKHYRADSVSIYCDKSFEGEKEGGEGGVEGK